MGMQKRKKGLWIVIIVAAIVIIAFSIKHYKKYREKSLQQIRISIKMEHFLEDIESPESREYIEEELEKEKEKISMYPELFTEDEIICWWLKRFMLKNLKYRDEYEEKMRAVNTHRLLDPVRIQEDMTLEESRDILRKAKNIVVTEIDKNIVFIQDGISGIDALGISNQAKVSMKADYSETRGRIILFLQNKKQLDLQSLSRIEDIVNLLEEKNGNWEIRGGAIVFNSREDARKYNALLSAIEEISKEQHALAISYVENL